MPSCLFCPHSMRESHLRANPWGPQEALVIAFPEALLFSCSRFIHVLSRKHLSTSTTSFLPIIESIQTCNTCTYHLEGERMQNLLVYSFLRQKFSATHMKLKLPSNEIKNREQKSLYLVHRLFHVDQCGSSLHKNSSTGCTVSLFLTFHETQFTNVTSINQNFQK